MPAFISLKLERLLLKKPCLLKEHVCVLISSFFLVFHKGKPWFCQTLTLADGEKMKCEVILLRNEMRGEAIEY